MQHILQKFYPGEFESMPQGQYEAAKILGYTKAQGLRIILPPVIKRILPAITMRIITLVKDPSLHLQRCDRDVYDGKALASWPGIHAPICICGSVLYTESCGCIYYGTD